MARARGHRQNERLIGVYDFSGDAAHYESRLDGWLHRCSDGDLLMCHPGLTTQESDPIRAARTNEFEVLAGAAFPDSLARARVERVELVRLSHWHAATATP